MTTSLRSTHSGLDCCTEQCALGWFSCQPGVIGHWQHLGITLQPSCRSLARPHRVAMGTVSDLSSSAEVPGRSRGCWGSSGCHGEGQPCLLLGRSARLGQREDNAFRGIASAHTLHPSPLTTNDRVSLTRGELERWLCLVLQNGEG